MAGRRANRSFRSPAAGADSGREPNTRDQGPDSEKRLTSPRSGQGDSGGRYSPDDERENRRACRTRGHPQPPR